MSDLVERLRGLCIDWTGEPIVDASTPRVEPSCAEVREAADRIEALESAWETLDRIATESIIETDQPDRIRWEGVWYDGPAATAFLSMLRAIQKMARATLNRSHGDDNG